MKEFSNLNEVFARKQKADQNFMKRIDAEAENIMAEFAEGWIENQRTGDGTGDAHTTAFVR